MSPERWRRIEEIYHLALGSAPERRAQVLAERCGDDPELHRDVEALLTQSDSSGELRLPVEETAARLFDGDELRPGESLGRYRIESRIGAGGMGQVYKAHDSRLGRAVAIKVSARRFGERFEREARTISALNHPNICTLYDTGPNYLVMELVEGETLASLLLRERLAPDLALRYAIQIADAIAAAHAAGIVHRDLKPGNIMVTRAGLVKVLDFSLAKYTPVQADADTETAVTEEGAVVGTVAYMSPEQAEGKPVDARSDIFSFGCVLYEMVAGRRPFEGDSRTSVLHALVHEEPKPVGHLAGRIPQDLDKVIHRCLRKDAARRFQHMDEVKVALEEIKEDSPRRWLQPETPPRRWRWAFAAGGLGAVLLSLVLWQAPKPAAPPVMGARRLTHETGFATNPALSRDGNLLAFVSDRAQDGGRDLWVQQAEPDAQPIRLTTTGDVWYPSFSPDGGRIVYYSQNADRGGLYTIPSLGGEPRLLLRDAATPLRPQYSPNGRWIAAGFFGRVPGSPFLIPAGGGPPTVLTKDFYSAQTPVWSSDGKKILFRGQRESGSASDWWVMPAEGGPAIQTGAAALLPKGADSLPPAPGQWIDDEVLYSTGRIWRIPVSSATGKVTGPPRPVTTGSGSDYAPSAARSPLQSLKVVFVGSQSSAGLWKLAVSGTSKGEREEPVKLFNDALVRDTPSLSTDGSRLVYIRRDERGGNVTVRVREMKTGFENTLLEAPGPVRVRISPDGSMVATNPTDTEGERVIDLYSADGARRQICAECGLIFGWAPDSKRIIFRAGRPIRFSTLDVKSGMQSVIVSHPDHDIGGVAYSPDGRWLLFNYAAADQDTTFFISSAHEGKAGPEREWVSINDQHPGNKARPWWSDDGGRFYYVNIPKNEIWAQDVDPAGKRPTGPPRLIYRAPSTWRFSIGPNFGAAVAPDGTIIFGMGQTTSNIWVIE